MPLLYSVVARGTSVLAKHAVCPGNFAEVTEQILAVTKAEDGQRQSFAHGDFLFHYEISNGLLFMAITDKDFHRPAAFLFLAEVAARFHRTYGQRANTALPYAMNADFSLVLSAEMTTANRPAPPDASRAGAGYGAIGKTAAVGAEVEATKAVLVKSMETMLERGERLELLVDRTANLEAGSVSFRTRSRSVARALWWKNAKIGLCIAAGVAVAILIITLISYSGREK